MKPINAIMIVCFLCSLFLAGCNPNSADKPGSSVNQPELETTAQLPSETLTPTATFTQTPSPTAVPTVFGGYKITQHVAYKCDKISICISTLDGQNKVNITEGLSSDPSYGIHSWSPDGKWLLFYSLSRFWLYSIDGSIVKPAYEIKNNSVSSSTYQVSWKPNGSGFVTKCPDSSDSFSGMVDLCFYDLQASSLQKLGISGSKPLYAPDGSSLAYMDISGDKLGFSFKLMQLKNGESAPTEVLTLPEGSQFMEGNYLWEPNGQHFLYAVGKRLFSVSTDGSNNIELAKADTEINLWPAIFSPDGNYLLFLMGMGTAEPMQNGAFNVKQRTLISRDICGLRWTKDNKWIGEINDELYQIDPDSGKTSPIEDADWLNLEGWVVQPE